MLGVFPLIDLAALAAYPADFFSDAELQVGKVLRSTRVVRVIMLLRIDRNAQAMTAGVTGPIPIFFHTSFKSRRGSSACTRRLFPLSPPLSSVRTSHVTTVYTT